MSSFANQVGQLENSLTAAGLPAAASTIIAQILGNGVQTLRHSGEMIHDKTPQGLRQVTPEARTHVFPELDFRQADPDFRRQVAEDSESRAAPVQSSTVVASRSPQASPSSLSRTTSGTFTEVSPSGDSSVVNLRVQGGGSFPVLDHGTNTVRAKTLRTESDGLVRIQLEDRADEVVIKGGFGPGAGKGEAKEISVVTDIEQTPQGIYFYRKKILAWVVSDDEPILIALADCSDVI